jgi:SRSO17 transposase
VAAKDRDPPSVAEVAKGLHDCFWSRRTVSEGTKGPIAYDLTKRQVMRCRDGLPERSVWLVLKRSLGAEPTSWYYISTAPLSARLPLFVWLSGVRWAIAQGFEEAKTALGRDHDEIRQDPGWHHHLLTCMLAQFFLWHLKSRVGKTSPSASGVAVADLAGSGVPPAHVYD